MAKSGCWLNTVKGGARSKLCSTQKWSPWMERFCFDFIVLNFPVPIYRPDVSQAELGEAKFLYMPGRVGKYDIIGLQHLKALRQLCQKRTLEKTCLILQHQTVFSAFWKWNHCLEVWQPKKVTEKERCLWNNFCFTAFAGTSWRIRACPHGGPRIEHITTSAMRILVQGI